MPFPDEAIDVRVELRVGQTWTDVTGHVYTRDPITITGGRSAEGSQPDPSRCTLTLNNRDGRYSPRNPLSPYYGQIGRNTPLRVSVPGSETYLLLPAAGSAASTPDHASLDITGDLDVRLEAEMTWVGNAVDLIGKTALPDQQSWTMSLLSTGHIRLSWSTGGTSLLTRTSTAPVSSTRRQAVRATLDVDNGAGGRTATFYTADSLAGPWTQLGDPVIATGTTSIFASTAPLSVGMLDGIPLDSKVYRAELRSGIDGTVVASPDFTAQADGTASFADAQGRTWSVTGGAELTSRLFRFIGEVPSWPVSWDTSGHNVWVPIEAAGLMRRLGQGAKPLHSAIFRSVMSAAPYTAYWPLEDAPGARMAASPYPRLNGMRLAGEVNFTGEPSGGTAGGASFGETGSLINGVPGGPSDWTVAFWIDLPADMGADGVSPVIQWRTPGNSLATEWSIYTGQSVNGLLVLEAADRDNNIVISEPGAIDVRGRGPVQVVVMATQDNGTIPVFVSVDNEIDIIGNTGPDTATPVTTVGINLDVAQGLTFSGTVSHLIVAPYNRRGSVLGHAPAGSGYTGETAAERIARLGTEEGVPVVIVGDATTAAPMGPQFPLTFLDLLTEAADADGGTLYEPRDALGLRYKSLTASLNTPVELELDYHDQVAAPLEATEDDQNLRNDVTVERQGGSSARVVVENGPLSTAAPPDGVGVYDEQVTVNVADDSQLLDQAGWRAHLGTVDEARYPIVRLKLHKHPDLIETALGLDLRSHIRLTGLPPWMPPGDVDLLIDGYTEVIEPLRWWLEWNTVPGSPWNVGVLDDPVLGRADTDASELAAAADADDTTLSVATTEGPRWVTDPAEFPFEVTVGGEVVQVTAISGTSSPQTFTVVRSQNGIVKAHTAGTDVRLTHPMILSM
jgi:hypothetical protein